MPLILQVRDAVTYELQQALQDGALSTMTIESCIVPRARRQDLLQPLCLVAPGRYTYAPLSRSHQVLDVAVEIGLYRLLAQRTLDELLTEMLWNTQEVQACLRLQALTKIPAARFTGVESLQPLQLQSADQDGIYITLTTVTYQLTVAPSAPRREQNPHTGTVN